MTPLLHVEGLTKHFPLARGQSVHACSDVSFELARGETLGVVGESGSGKTTLGRCILRLIEPSSGRVVLEGRDLTALSVRELRRLRSAIQIVFQEPYDSFNPQLTVGQQIDERLRLHKVCRNRAERNARVGALLESVGLPPEFAHELPGSLSGGELQRCSIARAIASRPKVLVLDEPTSALPPSRQADVIAVLQDLQLELGLAYILISHDLLLVRAICDRIAVMYLGQIVEMGSRDEVHADPQHPYTRALLASTLLPDPQQREDGRHGESLSGEIPSPVDLPKGCYLASRCPYAVERCFSEPQGLAELEGGRLVRCWRVAEGDLTEEEIESARRRPPAESDPPTL